MTTTIFRSWRQSYTFLVLATLAVVAAADFFLYNHRIGWTAALVAAAMLMVLAIRDTTFLGISGGRIAWLATIGLLFALVEQPTWLNILYIFVCLGVLALINTKGWDNDFVRWLRRFARWLATGWTRLFLDNGVAMKWLIRRGFSPALARGIAAWIIPLLFTSIFVALFAWANPIIAGWLSQLGTLLSNLVEILPELLNPARIFFWLGFAVVAWALLRSRTWGSRKAAEAAIVSDDFTAAVTDARDHDPLPASMVIRCLFLFNLVFAVEIVLDLYVMFSAKYGTDGTAFKMYVRRGAYPLVAAALMAGAFVLVTFRPNSDTEQSPWARRLVYLWIGQTILLTLSAVWRLVRYVDLTEMTRVRVASTVWFILVALGLFYIIWRIVRGRSNTWLINVNAITALLVLYPCCFINFDGMIASFNARHCEEAGGGGSALDIEYFETLGTPALAALDSVKEKVTAASRRDWAEKVSQKLHAELDADLSDWRAWTWRRHRTKHHVEQLQFARARDQQKPAREGGAPSGIAWTPPAHAAKVGGTFP
ncbi:MAG: hypothetical protein QOF78_3512 [Phycisphaerales bacterium]|jgi:hypothetical protein|nr:hypothetical protein [Phycisphaerales bacterium]